MKKNNLVLIVFDSCRYDTFAAAKTPNISRLGKAEKRYSFASWTVPSHATMLLGASAHRSPRGVFASEVYKKDFLNWGDRLNISDISFKGFLPKLSLPAFLKDQGYKTNALVSLPVLNQTTILNQYFDRYQLMKRHNDFAAIVDQMIFEPDQPAFYLLNVGETHYPYTLADENNDLPILHGVHGVFKHLDDLVVETEEADLARAAEDFFHLDKLLALKDKQRRNVEALDALFEKLYETCPPNTHFIVTSDHGECFGEEGYFGHGPVMHEKVFEVFFTEGRLR